MIHTVDIQIPTKTPVRWLASVPALAQPRTLTFKPGLNVLWGMNGSGKTTLIKLLARLFHCEQAGVPTVTYDSLRAFVGEGVDLDAVKVKHDGQGVRHFDPGHAVGLVGGMAGFDFDFGDQGIRNALFKGSAGQTSMFRFDGTMLSVILGEAPSVVWRADAETTNSIYTKAATAVKSFLKKNGAKGSPTVLLDEPERSLDVTAQMKLWRWIRAYASDVQFIVASHALFALKIPEANYVELSPGYRAQCEATLRVLATWPDDKPTKIPPDVIERLRARTTRL